MDELLSLILLAEVACPFQADVRLTPRPGNAFLEHGVHMSEDGVAVAECGQKGFLELFQHRPGLPVLSRLVVIGPERNQCRERQEVLSV